MLDVLWSDPKSTNGLESNAFRGGGCLFGPDVTQSALERNKVDLIIRSHECKEQGYEYAHNDKLLTIFSASNYYEYGSNKGAYARLLHGELRPLVVQFQVKKEVQQNIKNVNLKERLSVAGPETSAIQNLLEIFVANKLRLIQAYKLKDAQSSGAITLNDWCNITTEILNLHLPWRVLRPKLAELNKEGFVLYESTFEGLSLSAFNQKLVEEKYIFIKCLKLD